MGEGDSATRSKRPEGVENPFVAWIQLLYTPRPLSWSVESVASSPALVFCHTEREREKGGGGGGGAEREREREGGGGGWVGVSLEEKTGRHEREQEKMSACKRKFHESKRGLPNVNSFKD